MSLPTLDQIAAQLQGYDPQALSARHVSDFLQAMVPTLDACEALPLLSCLDRVLAQDLVSPLDVPPHDNSAMDGYAFDGQALESAERLLSLRVVGTALAGRAWAGQVGPGECVKIMTGAIMPAGTDTVVPQEMTQPDGERVLIPNDLLRPGDNRRLRGEDLRAGEPALHRGERITPARLGLAASLGVERLHCLRRLKVAYFSTGDEILSLGQPPREGAVYDSNRFTVFGLLRRLGCEVLDLGVVPDQPAQLRAAFTHAAREADVIISSGGVSVGEADHTKAMMRELGDVAFWRVAMRPGRPMAVGRLHDADRGRHTVLFGLPGNPVAVMVTFLAFVRPALLKMMGCTDAPAPLLRARSTEAMKKKPGRTEYQRGIVSRGRDGTPEVRTTGQQGSGVLSSMAQANGLIVLHHAQASVMPGDFVDVMMFDGVI